MFYLGKPQQPEMTSWELSWPKHLNQMQSTVPAGMLNVIINKSFSITLKSKVKVKMLVVSDSLQPHGLQPSRLLCPWNSPGKNTGVGSHSLLQRIFPTQGLKLGLPHCRQVLYHLSNQFSSVQFSRSVVSNYLRPHESQHVHHQLPEFTQTHVHRVGDAIQPSHPLSSPSPPAPNPSQHQGLFQ